MAFRFFEPHTAPNPPWPAPLPASWINDAWAVRCSPARPIVSTAGFCVTRPSSFVDFFSVSSFESSCHAVFVPRDTPTIFHISCCVAQVSFPQRAEASRKATCSLRMSTQTGLSALPSITMPSQPAYFSMVENLPPKPERVNQETGYMPTPTPTTSHRPPAEGTIVPLRGEVITQQTLAGWRPSVIVLSLQRSQNRAEPMPWPPPQRRYFSVGIAVAVLVVRSRRRIFPA
jgi:hypothetical protein